MKSIPHKELRAFLDQKVASYNTPLFIEDDPISIPHLFTKKEDIEISGFITATLAWGQRPVIIRNCIWLMEQMDNAPHDFIRNFKKSDLRPFQKFVHRTFNSTDCLYFLHALQQIYTKEGGLENAFSKYYSKSQDFAIAISELRTLFLSFKSEHRTAKHFADPLKNAGAKRLCMYLRWMIRNDKNGVDFGIWKACSPAILHAPLDLHSGRVARSLGLLSRKQDDWKAVVELTENLRKFDPLDPVKYDFALFGLGVNDEL